jgi:hypothetical protein
MGNTNELFCLYAWLFLLPILLSCFVAQVSRCNAPLDTNAAFAVAHQPRCLTTRKAISFLLISKVKWNIPMLISIQVISPDPVDLTNIHLLHCGFPVHFSIPSPLTPFLNCIN